MLPFWLVANTALWEHFIPIGGVSLSLNVLLITLVGSIWMVRGRFIAASTAKILLAFLGYGLISLTIVVSGSCRDHLNKFLFTIPTMLVLLLIGVEVGRRATTRDWRLLHRTAALVLAVAFAAFAVEFLVPSWFPYEQRYRNQGMLSGLFTEPSYNACSLFPCIALLLVAESKRARRVGLVALACLFLLSRSTTLVALLVAWVLYRLIAHRKFRQTAGIAVGFATLLIVLSALNYQRWISPTLERLTGVVASGDTTNISSLTYVQGWEDAWFNLVHTHGLGLGLNMMGCGTLPDVPARSVLSLFNAGTLNAEDGSFPFAKIVSETGVAGLLFFAAVIWQWLRLEKRLRTAPRTRAYFTASAQSALVFCFVVTSFLRGTGYFNGELLLWIVAASSMSHSAGSLSASAQQLRPLAALSPASEPGALT